MSTDQRNFMHPELMTESALLEVLKSRCIELPNFKTLRKSDLIEMFRRVALPMPQRRYNETKHFGKKLHELRSFRKIPVAIEEEQTLYESAISSQNNLANESNCERSKSPCEDSKVLPKKICLSNSPASTNGSSENGVKRKLNEKEVSAQAEVKKRQKITWP